MTQHFDALFSSGRPRYDEARDVGMSRLEIERESAGWTFADTMAAGLVAV